jgi:hypothetical protein
LRLQKHKEQTMKKIFVLAIALVAIGLTAFTACSGKKDNSTASAPSSSTTTPPASQGENNNGGNDNIKEEEWPTDKYGSAIPKPNAGKLASVLVSDENNLANLYMSWSEEEAFAYATQLQEAGFSASPDGELPYLAHNSDWTISVTVAIDTIAVSVK